MQRPGTRTAHAGAYAGHAGTRRAMHGVPGTVVPVERDLATGSRASPGMGEPIPVAANSGQPGGGTGAAQGLVAGALVAMGAGGHGHHRPGGGHASTDVANPAREAGGPRVAHGKRPAGST